MIVDSHVHVWNLADADYPWLGPGMGELYRSVEFAELEPTLAARGVDAVVLVQAADNAGDTEVMLSTARSHPRVAGVVAWAPIDDPGRLAPYLDAASDVVVGVRVLVHERESGWIATPGPDKGLAVLAKAGLPFDFVTADHRAIGEAVEVVTRHPELRLVLDHLGKPPIGGDRDDRAEWRTAVARLAEHPLAVAKLSGLYSMVGDAASWTPDAVRPFVEDALELFGADRLLYGGDWPISLRAGGYDRTFEALTELTADLTPEERDAIWGETAVRVYGLSKL